MGATFVDVEREYAKNKQLKREDVKMLQEWTAKQPHLPAITELDMILFLHSCAYSNEAAKACIETFYTVRAHCPEFFANRDPVTNPAEILDIMLYAALPVLTPEGNKVIFAKLIDTNPDKYSFATQIKAFDMTTMLMLRQEGTFPGQVVVTDMRGCTFAHVTKLNMVHLKKFFVYLQEGMPVRLVGLHFINIPSFMDKIMALIKPFMKKDLMSVLQLHTDNLETLYKFVPQKCLPKDYGGESPATVELLELRRSNILKHADYFRAEENSIVDESKRPGTPKNAGDVFGMEGTFKKLDID